MLPVPLQWGTTSLPNIFFHDRLPHSNLIAAKHAQLKCSIILPLWYQVPERAGELDESLHKFVPKLHQFSGKGLLRNTNLAKEERSSMGNYRRNGHSEGSVLQKTGGRTTGKDSRQQWEQWGPTQSMGAGYCEPEEWVGAVKKMLRKWRYEGKTVLEGQLLGAMLRQRREEEDSCYGGHQQGQLTWRVASRQGFFLEGRLQTREKNMKSQGKK